MRRLRWGPVCAVVVLLCAVGQPAVAALPPIGTDVSWPAYPGCLRDLPASPPFAIVGVNDGVATATNPCLTAQLAWAATALGTGNPAVEVYVNSANPGDHRAQASWWPTANRTRSGTAVPHVPGRCSGGDTVACTYIYGYSIATDDLQRGVPAVARWWIDVEKANTWSTSATRNRSVVEGMVAAFSAAHQRSGLYGLPSEVPWLLGTIPSSSPLADLPTWIAGDGDLLAAAHRCTVAPLSGGRVTLAQYTITATSGQLDQDIACGTFTATAKPRVTGARSSGSTLTAHAGSWRPVPTHLAYRWLRDGSPIASATHATYRLTRADRGTRVSVTVTATVDGYSRGIRTSASVRIAR